MKNLLLLLALVLVSVVSVNGQSDTTKINNNKSVGFEIREFVMEQRISQFATITGGSLMVVGSLNGQKNFTYVGGFFCLVGLIADFGSYGHLNRASIMMDNRGVGLAIKIGK